MADSFENVLGQPQVRDFLRKSIKSTRTSHAYLFVGPSGSNKTDTAYALAQALICPSEDKSNKGGVCGKCDMCTRIKRKTHPDVHFIAPEGANGYLVEQIRDVVSDVSYAPIQADKKIYILDRVDLLNASSANAFLKTLEEPPENVVFILLGRTLDSVLQTISSRCQIVPFRHIPPTEAAGIIAQNTGAPIEQAREAMEACSGSITKAISFISGNSGNKNLAYRQWLLSNLSQIGSMDAWACLKLSRDILKEIDAPIADFKRVQEADIDQNSDFLSKSAIRQIEARNKRQLNMKQLEMMKQTLSIMESFVRDAVCQSIGCSALIINVDMMDRFTKISSKISNSDASKALRTLEESSHLLDYNVSPELVLDIAIFKIREALNGSNSTSKLALQR